MTGTTRCRVGADVGGTFTDVLLFTEGGSVVPRKVLSTPSGYERGVVDAVSALLADSELDGDRVLEVSHGTTVATNAVLQRRGNKTALITTAGFRDVLEIRRLRTPHMYDPHWKKPACLVDRRLRFEIDERVRADGVVLRAPQDEQIAAICAQLAQEKVEAVAICFLHSYAYPEHERYVAAALRSLLPAISISLSSEILREQREYERTATAVVNAYVMPSMAGYLKRVREELDGIGVGAPLMIMKSSGGVMTHVDAARQPVFALESGPAAGVVAARALADLLGLSDAIAFDMGGTTAKASLIEAGQIAYSREYEVGGDLSVGSRLIRGSGDLLRIPTIDIAEVGAGGGSIAWIDPAGGLHLGPQSAGADPGPACYGLGGTEATVTDANVVLGLMRSGLIGDGQIEINDQRANAAVAVVAEALDLDVLEAARGIHALANARMMRALKAVSSERGRDPRGFALIAYGGAGPIHATGLAEELGVRTVVVPPLAGVFSAMGLLFARPELHDVRPCSFDLRDLDPERLEQLFVDMKRSLAPVAAMWPEIAWRRSAELRYRGQSWEIEVALPDTPVDDAEVQRLVARFETEHERLYSVRGSHEARIQIRSVRLAVTASATSPVSLAVEKPSDTNGTPATARRVNRDEPLQVAVVARHDLGGESRGGPFLIDEYDSTTYVPPTWQVRRDLKTDALIVERETAS